MKDKTTTQKIINVYTSKKVKNYALAFTYISIAIFFLSGVNFYFTDWEGTVNEIKEAIEEFGEVVDCKIEYQDFYYNGLCTTEHLDMIFNFLNTTKNIHEGD